MSTPHLSTPLTETPRFNTAYVLAISMVAALGGFLFGYDWVVIGGAKPFFEKCFALASEAQIGWANSCALLGCLVGAIAAAPLSDRAGRKPTLILSAFVFAASSILTGWAPSFAWFVVWRIAGGIAIGMASGISPMYIAEISPATWRGRLVALNQLTIVIGILAAQIANWAIAEPVGATATAEMIAASWNGQYGWRWMFTAVAAPAAVFFFAAMMVPESPRWHLLHGRREAAARTLTRIGGAAHARDEMAEFDNAQVEADAAPRPATKALAIGITLAVLSQWSGINVIFNYAEEIYRGAGYGVSDILFNIVITGAINLVFTLAAMAMVDRFGRRFLLIAGCASIAVSHLLLGWAYHQAWRGMPVLVFTLCAIGCYAMSLAPITWVIIAEIFPNRIRAKAVATAVSALWIACFLLTFTFPVLNRALGASGVFWLYGAICLAGVVFAVTCVPETKDRTLEQIERHL